MKDGNFERLVWFWIVDTISMEFKKKGDGNTQKEMERKKYTE